MVVFGYFDKMTVPSHVTDVKWLHYGQMADTHLPNNSPVQGKWMIFRYPTERDAKNRNELDRHWLKIVDKFEEFGLYHAIVTTAKCYYETKKKPVICCYTRDYEDVEEVRRTAKSLQEILGQSMFEDPDPEWPIPAIYYKTQNDGTWDQYDGDLLYKYYDDGGLYRKDNTGSWKAKITEKD